MPRCKHCRDKFEQYEFNNKFCKKEDCQVAKGLYNLDKIKKQKQKEWKKRKAETKEKLKTKKDYEKELQVVFNKYIRLRDQNKTCISCGTPLKGKFDAGHFYPVGSYKNLRFNEDNVHAQCVHCNQHKHGALNEYSLRLPERIGQERFNKLNEDRLIELHYSIPELIELKVIYKDKIKNYHFS